MDYCPIMASTISALCSSIKLMTIPKEMSYFTTFPTSIWSCSSIFMKITFSLNGHYIGNSCQGIILSKLVTSFQSQSPLKAVLIMAWKVFWSWYFVWDSSIIDTCQKSEWSRRNCILLCCLVCCCIIHFRIPINVLVQWLIRMLSHIP